MRKNIAIEIICFLLILLFVYAATSKLNNHEEFAMQLKKSPFITMFSNAVSWGIPLGEIFIGTLLIFKLTRLIGLYLFVFLMAIFSAYIYSMLNFSYYLPCSCGGILSLMSWKTHLWFNVAFLILSIVGIIIYPIGSHTKDYK